jgi:hypothetical protein
MRIRTSVIALTCAACALTVLGACSDGAEVIGGAAAASGDGASGDGAAGDGAAGDGASGDGAGSGPGAPGAGGTGTVEAATGGTSSGAEPGDGDAPAGAGLDGGLGGAPSSSAGGAGTAGSGAGGAGGAPTSSVDFIAPRGPCEVATRVGRFTVEKQVDFGVVQGTVSDGVVPSAVPALVLEQGNCQLVERRNLVCLPACVGSETCGESGTCIPFPRQISVGEVAIRGLTKETLMSPQQPGNSYFAPGADNPPYQVQGEVVLSASGATDLPAFQLFGIGSEPLAQAPVWLLEAGADLVVEWAAPTADVAATVLVELTIDQHGTSPLSLSCEFPDTGSASVPSSVIDRLLGAGISGFPNGRITRRTADHVDIHAGTDNAAAACVELAVGSPLAATVSVSGYTPCNAAGDCPEGQTCNVALQRCE